MRKSTMASSSSSSSATTISKKRLPQGLMDLLDVAIFTFACQTGLRTCHKVRGNPVLEGVCAFFGQLIQTANAETQKELNDIAPERFGGWQPGMAPSPQVLTLVSSRIKTHKTKRLIREDTNPVVPSLLVEKKERFDDEEERVRTTRLARCWRCKSRCRFCLKRKHNFPKFGNFRIEIVSPFLDVLEELLKDEEDLDDENSEQSGEGEQSDVSDSDYQQCISGEQFEDVDDDEEREMPNETHEDGELEEQVENSDSQLFDDDDED